MQNKVDQAALKKQQIKLSTIDSITQGMISITFEGQKQGLKQIKLKIVQKTQKIKKEKKNLAKNEYYTKAQIQEFENQIITDSINRLKNRTSNSSEDGSIIYKKLTRQRLLEFLQFIQEEYIKTINIYLQSNINKEECGNLKKLFLKFIDGIVQAFPVLNNIVYRYAFQYYKTGPLKHRFDRLMDKTITPMLNQVSQQFLNRKRLISQKQYSNAQKSFDVESTQISKSPQRQILQEFEEQKKKKEQKKMRRKNRRLQQKMKNQQKNQEKIEQIANDVIKIQQLPKQYQQMNKMLEGFAFNQNRLPSRIDQDYLQKWKAGLGQNY